ncbi:hypothetical protein D3C78_1535210 [compost metagenome]
MAARMPTMATTIITSMRVKPAARRSELSMSAGLLPALAAGVVGKLDLLRDWQAIRTELVRVDISAISRLDPRAAGPIHDHVGIRHSVAIRIE